MSTDESADQEHIIKALLSRIQKLRRQRDHLKERVQFFKELYFTRCSLVRHLRNVIKRKDRKIRRLERMLEELRSMVPTKENQSKWKLFVWTDVFCDWTCGLAFAIARSREEAIEILKEKYPELKIIGLREELENSEPDIYELPGLKWLERPAAYLVYGGS